MEFLDQFQALSGQIVLGIAILLAVLLWKLLGASKASANVNLNGTNQVSGNIQSSGAGGATPEPTPEKELALDKIRQEKQIVMNQQIRDISDRISKLLPKVKTDLENIIRSWCQMGESGKFRLACFAEIVGQDLGKLPIPIDALADVSKIFSQMAERDSEEKKQALEKVYWDFLSALNLGTESLSQPFAYLGGMNLSLVNQILMEENPKMKTLVSLFMPNELRTKYISNLEADTKKSLLREAIQLNQIPKGELRNLEGSLAGRLKPSQAEDILLLEKSFNRLATALSPTESVTMLFELSSSIPVEYKQNNPNLAFLAEWPDDKLSVLLGPVMADELTAFLRLRPDLKDRLIKLAPPMTAEMVTEELDRPVAAGNTKELDRWLVEFQRRLDNFVRNGTLNLEEIFNLKSAAASTEGPAHGTDKKAS